MCEEKRGDVLADSATRSTIQELYGTRLLSAEARDAALRWIHPPAAWWEWASRLLLFVGAGLVLAGIVFFFAYNWAAMGAFVKFAVIEGGILGCLVAAWFFGLERLGGKVLLLAACVLIGVFLAVFGQVYQTGADAYELFRGWCLLILPWVVVSRFGALWMLWLAILDTAIILYWNQVIIPERAELGVAMYLVLAPLNGAALVAREIGERRGISWLRHGWLRWVLLASLLIWLDVPVFLLIAGEYQVNGYTVTAVALVAAGLLASYLFYRFRSPDLLALTLATAALCVLVLALSGRIIFELSDYAGMYLIFSAVVVVVVSVAALWLGWQGWAMRRAARG